MHRFVVLGVLSLVFSVVIAESAHAQYRRRPRARSRSMRRPTTSPYLDLLGSARNNRGFSQEYFRRVRPEMELRRESAELARSIAEMNSQMASQRALRLRQQREQMRPMGILHPIASGHPTSFLSPSSRFFNYGGYYR